MVQRIIFYTGVFVFFSLMVTGCGVKPGTLEPPPGAEDVVFPRTYPAPSTDPVH